MVATSHHRGHAMWFDESVKEWRYMDGALVKENWQHRPCGKCGEHFTSDGHDPCIANLPNVQNACCGHGNESDAYIQFCDRRYVSGREAIESFAEITQ